MKRLRQATLGLSAAISTLCLGISGGVADEISVSVTNVEMVQGRVRGTIYVCLYPASVRGNPEFPSCEISDVRKVVVTQAGDGTIRTKFTALAPGRYALSAFQDTDGDAKLTMGFGGILPKERVGTYRSTFTKPKFDDIAFDVSGSLSVTIKLIGF